MILAIDIGNSHTVIGIFQGSDLLAEWRMATVKDLSPSDIGDQMFSGLKEHGVDPGRFSSIGIASVVPSLTEAYTSMTSELFHQDAVVINGSLDLGFTIKYSDPLAVGADRLCNAIAGYAKHGGPLIIIDFGTATTYDVVARNGDYLGGVIAPGVETSASDLHRRAARLPRIQLELPPSIIGKDTASSMQAGILFGAIDGMEGMVKRLQDAITASEGTKAETIGTGGFSGFISQHSTVIAHLEPSLVLDGIRLICERNAKVR